MVHELSISPSGRLFLRPDESSKQDPLDAWTRRVVRAFDTGPSAGLFSMAAHSPETPPSPSFGFWRDIARRYLTAICRLPEPDGERIDPIEPPGPGETATILENAPPMVGGEYLNRDVLVGLWAELDEWVRGEVASSGRSLAEWLKKHAPPWRRVGRVCLHLAENKRDPELPFAFLATYAPYLSRDGRVQYRPLGKALQEYAGAGNRKALIALLSPVHRASETCGFMKELVDSGDVFRPLAWPPETAYRFLKELPTLEESGLLVRVPDWWRKRARPRVSVTIGDRKQSRFGAETMLDFKVEVALEGHKLTDEDWQRITASREGLVFLKGQWIEVDREKLSEALSFWKELEARAGDEGISFIEGMRLLAGASADLKEEDEPRDEVRDWSFVDAGTWLSEVLAGLREPDRLAAAGQSKHFQGSLRPYQETGHNWLWFLTRLGLGACLADDMGLGKTVQVLSLLSSLKEEDHAVPSLLILPASLLSNWKAEIERFAPALSTCFVHPSETPRADLEAMAEDPDQAISGIDLVVTTYGMLLRQDWVRDVSWRLAILDEAQAVKNPSARQTRAVKRLQAGARIALTGTPVENRLSDLWSLFDFLCPGLLGSASRFKAFVKALEEREQDRYAPLRNLVRPYVLRRLKTDKAIISDLPEKTEMKAFCGLSRGQAALYAESVRELSQALEGLDGMKRRGLVLSYLLRFKQICNHPSQLLGDGAYDPAESGKFDRLRALAEEIASRQEKVLVFTQFREMTGPLAGFLAEIFGREGAVLHGSTAVKRRRSLIDAFQREDGPPFFVLSLKAGGTGLNLTAASHVIHFDRWWNPAVENQATDRAFRIGQRRNVLVHKFVCRGTIEEKIDELVEEKARLAGDLLESGPEAMLTEMSDQDLLNVVTLDINRAEVT
ncbi:MAG: DEAD/DEAH box helicase [Deltaproteobacteria bacterium]|nr:DEAD/DEAH box helicase [Deltaproteobacteria bacterium]